MRHGVIMAADVCDYLSIFDLLQYYADRQLVQSGLL